MSDSVLSPLIFIHDDEDVKAEILGYDLENARFATVVAPNGEEVVTHADRAVPDLVVLDWTSPECSGANACCWPQTRAKTMEFFIFMLTASSEDGGQERGTDAEANDYIVKS